MFDAFISRFWPLFAFPFRFYVDQQCCLTSPRPICGPCDPKISACCMSLGPVDIKRSVNSLYSHSPRPRPVPGQSRQNNKTLEKHLLISCANQRGTAVRAVCNVQRATKMVLKTKGNWKELQKKKCNAIMRRLNEVLHSLQFYVRACAASRAVKICEGSDDLSGRFMYISNY